MLPFIGVIIAALFLVLVVDVPRVGLVTGFVALALGALFLILWHRRQLAELRERHTEHEGLFVLVSKAQRWPKSCVSCHHRVYSHREASRHSDPALSPCAALAEAREARELAADRDAAEAPKWTATVIKSGRGDGAIDTLEGGDDEL
jgi:hypothetical protein